VPRGHLKKKRKEQGYRPPYHQFSVVPSLPFFLDFHVFLEQPVVKMAMPLRDLAPATSPPRAVTFSTLSTRRRQKSYQACEHCRRRKAKCELEEIHGIIASSCVRCRRERKKCIFSAERSAKPKPQSADSHGMDESPDSGSCGLLVHLSLILLEVLISLS
jgi:hypothetical protein